MWVVYVCNFSGAKIEPMLPHIQKHFKAEFIDNDIVISVAGIVLLLLSV